MSEDFVRILRRLDEESLSRVLQRVIRAAQRASDNETERWARLELLGYVASNAAMTEEVEVPAYRTIAGQWANEFGQRLMFENAGLAFVNEIRLRTGVVELEGLSGAKQPLAIHLPEYAEILRKIDVEASFLVVSPSAIQALLAAIRMELSSRLTAHAETLRHVDDARAVQEEILELRPNFFGLGINLRALWRRLQGGKNHSDRNSP